MSKLFNNVVVTGTSSGVGYELLQHFVNADINVLGLTRQQLDLADVSQVLSFTLPACDLLINCAGTDVGGKIDFANHSSYDIAEILNTNLISPVLLSQKALKNNSSCKIINITSTNNNRYWPNNLAYSLSKKGLESFSNMLRVEYPSVNLLEVRLGLTSTNFNNNRYKHNQHRFEDIYSNNKHLQPADVAAKIIKAIYDPTIKYIEISP